MDIISRGWSWMRSWSWHRALSSSFSSSSDSAGPRPGLFAEETSWRQRHRWLEKATMTICSWGKSRSCSRSRCCSEECIIEEMELEMEPPGECIDVSKCTHPAAISPLLSVSHCTWSPLASRSLRPCPPLSRGQNFLANLYLRTWRNTRAPVYKWGPPRKSSRAF